MFALGHVTDVTGGRPRLGRCRTFLRGLQDAGGRYMTETTVPVRDGSQEYIIRAPGIL